MEQMVLGNSLQSILEQILNLFSNLTVPTQFGPKTPINPDIKAKVDDVKRGIENMLSIYHNIEGN